MLMRYEAVWVFNFPQPTIVTVRCPRDEWSWETVLETTGIRLHHQCPPTKMGKNNYFMYRFEFTHFALADSRRDYDWLRAADLQQCIVTNAAAV
jgi:hypothetical protein